MKRRSENTRERSRFSKPASGRKDQTTAHPLLKLQRSAGNQAVANLLAPQQSDSQPVELETVAAPTNNDLGQQADQTANDLAVSDSSTTSNNGAANDLSSSVQARMEASLGIDRGSVHLHTGARAE